MAIASAREILDFWFGAPDAPDYGQLRKIWFIKNSEFDQALGHRFGTTVEAAALGKLQSWRADADSCLALLLLLDQFPRNLYRGQAQAFAMDGEAVAVANHGILQRFDRYRANEQARPTVQRWFFYLPFEHSERLADQERAVALFEQLRGDGQSASTIDYAHRHRAVIEQFGRFPHRNAALGRMNTPEETRFLQQPGSSF
jgi:uncharacterized protein (DUF924 family)